jgi:diadenylate cyclase
VNEVLWILQGITLTDVIDILAVTLLFWAISFLFRGTQAAALLRGLLFVVLVLFSVAGIFQLQALSWLLTQGLTLIVIAIPIVFQPELRRGLEQLGRGGILFNQKAPETIRLRIIEEICMASERLAERRHGALMVLQRNSNVQEFIETGVTMNSEVNAEVLLTIFWPRTELHDGAVMVDRNGRIAAAACVLPLTASRNLPHPKMGTRHRAALGISEVSDAICVVVSEETGRISVTNAGRMVSRLDRERLHTILNAFYGQDQVDEGPVWRRFYRRLQQLVSTDSGVTEAAA